MMPRTEGKAVASLVLGALSLVPLVGALTGVPAIILGARARRDIDRSNGTLDGRGLAASGIVSGLFGTGLAFVLVLWVMGVAFSPSTPEEATSATRTSTQTTSTATQEQPSSPTPSQPQASSPSPLQSGSRSYGSLEVIDLDESRPLRAQLGEIVSRSRGRTIVLQTYVKASAACVAVDAALPDTRMQRALANVTLVRVDIEEYEKELGTMKVETKSAPWFYKLDAKGDPTEAISAEAWDANIPENMAPVLGKFVQHRTPSRRTR